MYGMSLVRVLGIVTGLTVLALSAFLASVPSAVAVGVLLLVAVWAVGPWPQPGMVALLVCFGLAFALALLSERDGAGDWAAHAVVIGLSVLGLVAGVRAEHPRAAF